MHVDYEDGHDHRMGLPRVPLYAAFALVIASVLLVAVSRIGGVGQLRTPLTEVTAQRLLLFADRADGAVVITDARSDAVLEIVAPGEHGFLRGALRGLGRERKRSGIAPTVPFRLTSRSDGRLLLEDPSTGRLIDLGAFGPSNVAIFTRLLAAAPPPSALDRGQPAVASND